MKLLITLGLLIAVTASPLPSLPSNLPPIPQESEQNEVNQHNAFILEVLRNELRAQAGNLDEREINDDTLSVLNALKEVLYNKINEDDNGQIKVQEIAKNNGLEYVNKELEKKQNEPLSDGNSDNNNIEKNPSLIPGNVLRSDNILNNEDDSDRKSIIIEQPDQYELKIAGFEPHIENFESNSDESSDSETENDSESSEENKNGNNVVRKFDSQFFRAPQLFQIRLPAEL